MAYKFKVNQAVWYKQRGRPPLKAVVMAVGDGGYVVEFKSSKWGINGTVVHTPTREFCSVEQLEAIEPYSDGLDNWD